MIATILVGFAAILMLIGGVGAVRRGNKDGDGGLGEVLIGAVLCFVAAMLSLVVLLRLFA